MLFANGEREPLLVAIGGPRGVGKTTVLKHLVAYNSDFRAVFMSDELRVLCHKKLSKNFFEATIEEKDQSRRLHGEQLIARLSRESSTFLLDLHYTDITEREGKIIQPDVVLRHINVFALLDAMSDVILERMLNQEARGRVQSISSIENDRISEITVAENLAARYDKPYLYLNAEGPIETVAFGLYGLLQCYRGV